MHYLPYSKRTKDPAGLSKQISGWNITTLGWLICLFAFGEHVGPQSSFPGDCTTLFSKSEQTLIEEEEKTHQSPLLFPCDFPKAIYEGHCMWQQCHSRYNVQTPYVKFLCRVTSCRGANFPQSYCSPGEPMHQDIAGAGGPTSGYWCD